jgi:hypothetical protein
MKAGDILELIDRDGSLLGLFRVRENKSGAWCGDFSPANAYEKLRPLFEEFASYVNQLSLAHADEAQTKIDQLGICARLAGISIPIYDIQIYPDGASIRTEPQK